MDDMHLSTIQSAMQLPLTNGGFAIVDADWFEMLIQVNWHRMKTGYVGHSVKINGKSKFTKLHRLIIDAPPHLQVDHRNGNKLDNTRANLRLCQQHENSANTRSHKDSTSKFKGVSYSAERCAWIAQICHRRRNQWIGRFPTQVEAALAYNEAASRLFGEFARLNDIETQ